MAITPNNPANFTPTMQGYTGQGSFRFWCQTVLPLVYDDSLSYYELLNKVVVYLNNVISDVSTVETNVGEIVSSFDNLQGYVNNNYNQLVDAYNTLEGYVNDYFTNLDVQEEINTKLDIMANDGSLSNLLSPLMPNLVTAWLNEHVTPTSPVIDNTLSIPGAGGDAQKTGKLVADVYDPVSGTYKVGEYVNFEGTIYRCVTAIATPEAWTRGKWKATNVSEELADLKSDLKSDLNLYGASSILQLQSGTSYPGSLTVVSTDKDITISGTTTGSGYTHYDIFNSNNTFPSGISPGMNLQISQICADNNIRLRVYNRVNDNNQTLCDIGGTGSAQIQIDPNATGCVIRISVANGHTYNEVKTIPYVFDTLTKQQIQSQIDGVKTSQEETESSIVALSAYFSEELADLKSDLKSDLNLYGASSILQLQSGTSYPGSLTVVSTDKDITISGTTTGSGYTHYDIFNSNNTFPSGISPGMNLQISQICADNNIRLRVYNRVNDNNQTLCDIGGTGSAQIQIDPNATGCIIRISIANGHTYNEVKTIPYVFNTLTKQQTENQIESLILAQSESVTDIINLRSLMATSGDDQYLNPDNTSFINARVDSSNKLISDNNYVALIIPHDVISDKTYFAKIFGETVTVDEIKLYTFNSVTLGSYSVDNPNLYNAVNRYARLSSSASANYFVLVLRIANGNINDVINNTVISMTDEIPAEYVPYNISVDAAIEKKCGKVTSHDCIEIGTNASDYLYTNIETAVQENPNSIIKVNYGTYETEITDLTTDKILIGSDINLCVLSGTNKNYDTPPIEIAGGIVKHFTVSMVNNVSAEHKGYCLHSDNAACANNSLTVEDCKFTCVGQHSVGMGLYPNEEVIYKNCEFIFNDEEVTPTHAPFFAHNSGSSDGTAVIRFHNCIFRGSGYAIKLSAYSSNCSMRFEFIDCTCESDTLTGDNMVWTDYVTGSTHDDTKLHTFTGKMTLLPTSHGNNVDVLNA